MQRFKQLLCVVDPQQPSDMVLERAVSLARNNQAALTVVSVAPHVTAGLGMPDGGLISPDIQKVVTADLRQRLEQAVARFRSQITIEHKVLEGIPFLEIIREVLRNDHDLVIKAPEDPDWINRLFGSDDMHLLRKCPCPVWLIKHAASKTYRRILVAVDVDEDHPSDELAVRHQLNVKLLQLAVSLALSEFAELHVAHAWDAIGEGAMRSAFLGRPEVEVSAYIEQVRQQHDNGLEKLLDEVIVTQGNDALQFLRPMKHVVKGLPRTEIPRLAKGLDVDLVVMGTVARTGIPGLFIGNTAEEILQQIECSVLAVKPQSFVTPVTVD